MRVVGPDGYIEPGDEVELFDEYGLSLGLVLIVEDIDHITFCPTTPAWVRHMRVTDPTGMPSAILSVPAARVTGRGELVTINPHLRFEGRKEQVA